jgi:hypothetical protein
VAQGTTSTASGAVRAVGHAVPAAQPVTEPAANAIDALGRGLGGALKHLTAPR